MNILVPVEFDGIRMRYYFKLRVNELLILLIEAILIIS